MGFIMTFLYLYIEQFDYIYSPTNPPSPLLLINFLSPTSLLYFFFFFLVMPPKGSFYLKGVENHCMSGWRYETESRACLEEVGHWRGTFGIEMLNHTLSSSCIPPSLLVLHEVRSASVARLLHDAEAKGLEWLAKAWGLKSWINSISSPLACSCGVLCHNGVTVPRYTGGKKQQQPWEIQSTRFPAQTDRSICSLYLSLVVNRTPSPPVLHHRSAPSASAHAQISPILKSNESVSEPPSRTRSRQN